jgi:hypothetical protein
MAPALVMVAFVAVVAAAACVGVGGDMNSDRSECADQLVGLAPCLQYVQGEARTPAPDCCGGLRQVLGKSPKCLCVLVKDKDDPNLGIKINASLALALPSACGATKANVSHCPGTDMTSPSTCRRVAFHNATVPNFLHSYATWYLAYACMLARFSVVLLVAARDMAIGCATTSTPPTRRVRATVTSHPCAGLSGARVFSFSSTCSK